MPQRRKRSFAVGAERALGELLDIGGDMRTFDGGDARPPGTSQQIEEFDGGARIGAARLRIANVGGEEFKEAIGRALAGRCHRSRQ